jgi:hypothetical protein
MAISYLKPFTPAFFYRPLPQPKQARALYPTNFFGSSSTSGNQTETESSTPKGQNLAPPISFWLEKMTLPGQIIYNYGVGGTDEVGVQGQMTGAAVKTANAFIQCDLQDGGININGGGHGRLAWLYNTVWDRDNAGASPLLDASVYTDRRWYGWVGTNGWAAGSLGWAMDAQFEKLAWAEWPGQIVNETRYWQWAPSSGANDDDADKALHQQPSSHMGSPRGHRNGRGYRLTTELWILDAEEALQGGLPFFPDHRYDITAATCQTNGGVVTTLGFTGSLTGCTLRMLRADGSTHPDFAINSGTAAVTRATGTLIKNNQDIFLEVRKGDRVKIYHLELNLSTLTTAPALSRLDGKFGLSVWCNDNSGTLYAPNYPEATARVLAGLPTGQTEGSCYFVFAPEGPDNIDMYLFNLGPSFRRITTGAVRMSMTDDGAQIFGQTTTAAAALAANGLMYGFYSFSCPNNRQQLVLLRDTTNGVVGTGSVTTINSRTTGLLNPIADTGSSFNGGLMFGGSSGPSLNPWIGLAGPQWASNKEIDWSISANRDLVRAGVGTFVDLGASGVITPASGPNAGVPITPYHYFTGQSYDFLAGRNRGTGGDWFSWQIRDWRRVNWNQGVPIQQ